VYIKTPKSPVMFMEVDFKKHITSVTVKNYIINSTISTFYWLIIYFAVYYLVYGFELNNIFTLLVCSIVVNFIFGGLSIMFIKKIRDIIKLRY